MEIKTKHRIIGIIAIIALAVIIVPFFLNRSQKSDDSPALSSHVPSPPLKSATQIPVADSTDEDNTDTASKNTASEPIQPSAVLNNQAYEPPQTAASATPEQIQAGAKSNLATQALQPINSTISSKEKKNKSAANQTQIVAKKVAVNTADTNSQEAKTNAAVSQNNTKSAPTVNTKSNTVPRNKNGTVKIKIAAAEKVHSHHFFIHAKHHAMKQVALSDAWTIQLGSFSQKDNAEKLVKQLRRAGFSAYINHGRSGSSSVTRVFVGPEIKRAHADDLVKKLQQAFQLKGVVVKYRV